MNQPEEPVPGKRPIIRLSEKSQRPLAFGNMIEFMKEMPPLEIPPTNPPDFMGQSNEGTQRDEMAAPGSHQSDTAKDKTESSSTVNNKNSRDTEQTRKA